MFGITLGLIIALAFLVHFLMKYSSDTASRQRENRTDSRQTSGRQSQNQTESRQSRDVLRHSSSTPERQEGSQKQENIAELGPEYLTVGEELIAAVRGLDVTELKGKLLKYVNSWRKQELNVAVIGESGTGKSSFINSIRGISHGDNNAAATDAIETTTEPTPYPHPKCPNLLFWDLPGVGTPNFPQNRYLERIAFEKYDFYLLLSETRFRENDLWLAKEIRKNRKKFFFIRTKVDISVQGEKLKKISMNEEALLNKIRSNCTDHLKRENIRDIPVFLISNWHPFQYDFQKVAEKIMKDFPKLKKEAIVLSLACSTKESFQTKKETLKQRIWKLAVAAAINGAFPIPLLFTFVDRRIIENEYKLYRESFGIDEASLKSLAEYIGYKTAEIELALENSALDYLKKISQMLEESAKKEASKGFMGRYVPVISSIIGSTTSYLYITDTLNRLLNETEEEASILYKKIYDNI